MRQTERERGREAAGGHGRTHTHLEVGQDMREFREGLISLEVEVRALSSQRARRSSRKLIPYLLP